MKKIFIATICMLIYSLGFSQIFKDPRNIFPFTPETSSLLKYQETPVSNYTGVPNISIPIYTAKSGSVEVPITLSYHAGGVLVSDIASSVGLGWSINTVAPITRKTNGYTDENGVMKHDDNIEGFLNSNLANQQLRLNMATNGLYNEAIADLMPDEFSLSINDFSGSFFYNPKNKKNVTFPMSDIKIDYSFGNTNQIKTIDIKTTNGTKYIFGEDGTETYNLIGSISTSNYFGTNAWKIKKIEATDNSNIDFYYITNNILKRELAAQTKNIVYQTFSSAVGCNDPISTPVVDPDLDPQDADIQYESKEALLDKIITSDAIISFEYSNRLDFVDLKRLDKIIIKDKSGHLIAEKRFNYEYFQSLIDLPAPSDPTEDKTKRLKLLSYQECDRDGKCTTTSFEYYEQNKMTQRLSYATDHWGYFNNKTNNKGFPNVPIKYQDTSTNTPVKAFASDLGTGIIQIADKNVNPDYVQTFSLKSITYPEGGKNEFIYEPNTASSLLYRPDEEHYFLAKNNIIKRDFFFSVTGSVTGEDINYGIPPNSSINNTKIFIKEIDLTNYNKQLNLKITRSSTFKASTFSNYLDSSYLYAEMSVFYYENGVKKYWIVDSPMNVQTVINFNQYNNSNIPLQKVYVEIKHTYWGGLGSGNISNYMYFYSQVSFNWEENNPNLSDDPIIYAGGIRIKEIKQYDNGQYKYSTKYIYKKAENPQFSSGVLFNIPMYTKNKRIGKVDEISCYSGGHRTYKIAKNAIELSTRPVIAGMRTQGRTIGYTNVEVIKTDINNIKGREIFQYYVESPFQSGDNHLATTESTSAKYEFMESRDWRNGQLLKYIAFNSNNDTIKISKRDFYLAGAPNASVNYHQERNVKMLLYNLISPTYYSPGGESLIDAAAPISSMAGNAYVNGVFPSYIGLNNNTQQGNFPIFVKHSDAFLLKRETTTDYFIGGKKKSKISEYFYDNPLYPTTLTSKKDSSSGEDAMIDTSYKYAPEKGNQKLVNANMIGITLETEVKENSKMLSKIEIKYDNPLNLFPTSVLSYDLQNTVSTEITYDQYDSKGNLLQYTTKDGISTAIIWGYNSTQPIAKIVGATYAQVSSLAADIISASDSDTNATTEQDLIDKLDIFRKQSALSSAQITTYTYDPLIGVKSITPPSGIREVYLYDTANRLKEIRENSSTGKVLKEFKYNYKL